MMKKSMNFSCGLIGVSVVLFSVISGAVSGTIRYDENLAEGEYWRIQDVVNVSILADDSIASVATTAGANSSWEIETLESGGNVTSSHRSHSTRLIGPASAITTPRIAI